jgi:serine/threonine protein kinase
MRNHPNEFKNCDNKLNFFIDMVDAVQHLHNYGIIHGDIKHENFLVQARYFEPRVAISDFGFARTENENPHSICGTLLYFSPELLKVFINRIHAISNKNPTTQTQEETVQQWANASNKKSDVWALGTVLLSFFQHDEDAPWFPSQSSTDYDLAHKMMRYLVRFEEEIFKEPESNTLQHLVWQMLRKDPAKRICAEDAYKKIQEFDLYEDHFKEPLRLQNKIILIPQKNYDLYERIIENLNRVSTYLGMSEEDIHKAAHVMQKFLFVSRTIRISANTELKLPFSIVFSKSGVKIEIKDKDPRKKLIHEVDLINGIISTHLEKKQRDEGKWEYRKINTPLQRSQEESSLSR